MTSITPHGVVHFYLALLVHFRSALNSPGPDRFRELVRVTTNVLAEFIRAHSVYSRGAVVSLDPVKGLAEVPALEY